jgi:CHAT domain-containing protein/Tfp pilus assembly protein PilF
VGRRSPSFALPIRAGALAFLLALPSLQFNPLQAATAGQAFDRAVFLYQRGESREALTAFRRLAASTGNRDPALAAAALNNACSIASDLGDFQRAARDCDAALQLRRQQKDSEGEAETLSNLGRVQEALGESAEAARSFSSSLALARRIGDREGEAIALGNLGSLEISIGRFSSALDRFAEMEALALRHRGEPWSPRQAAVARIDRGVALERVGARREALALYRQLLADPRALDPGQQGALLVSTGVLYRNLGDPVQAESAFREAIALFERQGDEPGLSNASLNLGLALHLNLSRSRAAEAAFREALKRSRASGDRTEEILDLVYLGRLLTETGRLDEAEESFERCLEVAQAPGSAEGRWSAFDGLGRVARARGDLPSALRHFEAALADIESIRAGLATSAQRAGYFGDKREVYSAAVSVLVEMDRGQPGKGFALRAFELVQRAKARDLLDLLHLSGAPKDSAGSLNPNTSRRGAPPLRAPEIQRRLGAGIVLEYFATESRLLLWVLRSRSLRLFDLGEKAPYLAATGQVHRSLARGEEPDPEAVARLSKGLLIGLAETAQGEEPPLHIAGDGLLRYLPFEILEDPGRPGRRLIERSAVSYLPSASTLGALGRRDEGEAETRFLGVGAPVSPEVSAGSSLSALLAERFRLAPLPGAAREIAAARAALGGKALLLTGSGATESGLRAALASKPAVLHFATHAVIDEGQGQGAAILLSPDAREDGLLVPEEIARLPRSRALTILAACKTALVDDSEGRALTSLTGAFLAAGSPAVVATLWDVGDADSEAFMRQLYARLGRGEPPAEAVRQAKLAMLADPRWKNPARWAGYVVVGDGPPVVPRRTAWAWTAGAAGLGLLLWALSRYRRPHQTV